MTTALERVRTHRNKMRSLGFRPIQMWVPDPRSDGFAQEAKRQSEIIGRHDVTHSEDQDWVDTMSVFWQED